MKKSLLIGIVVVGVILLLVGMFASMYNSMVDRQVKVESAWAQVQNDYQRRLDLIPNLVSTVKGAAEFEKSTLTAVIEARANATQVKVDPSNMTPEDLAKFQQAQGQLSTALGRLMVVVEQYPDLKANRNFSELQVQLESTENRISNARRKFNEAANDYNAYIRKFPQVMLAGVYGFHARPFFEAETAAQQAPKVAF
ncbi:MAG: LemA family protein [Bacteroidota bacterium]|jgi:LemA protein